MKRVAASLKEDIASASLHQIWQASTNLTGLWSEMNEGRKSMPKENLKTQVQSSWILKKLTTFNFQGAVLFIQWVPPQVHHTLGGFTWGDVLKQECLGKPGQPQGLFQRSRWHWNEWHIVTLHDFVPSTEGQRQKWRAKYWVKGESRVVAFSRWWNRKLSHSIATADLVWWLLLVNASQLPLQGAAPSSGAGCPQGTRAGDPRPWVRGAVAAWGSARLPSC